MIYNRLKIYRISNKLSQEELGQKTGLSQNTISAIENGAGLSLSHAFRIARFFAVPIECIFSDNGIFQEDTSLNFGFKPSASTHSGQT